MQSKQTIAFAAIALLLAAAVVWLLITANDLKTTVKEVTDKVVELNSTLEDQASEIDRLVLSVDSSAAAIKLLAKRVSEIEDD